MFTKQLDCADCGYEGRSARELTFCPNCQSSNILTMTNRQVRNQRRHQDKKAYAIAEALMNEEQAIQSVFTRLSHL